MNPDCSCYSQISSSELKETPQVEMINGSFIEFSDITHVTKVGMKSQDSKNQLPMFVTTLEHYTIVLGIRGLWLHKFAVHSESNSVMFELLDYIIQGHDVPASVRKNSVQAEWLRQGARTLSELSQSPRWQITLRPAPIPSVALHISLRSQFCRFFSLCRYSIVNKHCGIVANCDHMSEWID